MIALARRTTDPLRVLQPRQRVALMATVTVLVAACDIPTDDSGIGGFDRTPTAQVAALASIDGDGNLIIVEQEPVNGRVGDPSLPPAGPVRHLRDPLDYRLDSDRVYLMLLAPAVEAHQDPDLGPGQYTVLYLHDPDTDLPAGRFPERGVDPEAYLDCIRTNFGTATRFDGLVAAVNESTNSAVSPLGDCI